MLRKIPNILTIGRIIIVPFFVLAFYLPGFYGDLTALILFIVASFTDFLDGMLARMLGEESKLGELLDPIADKIIVATALILLVMDGTIRHYEVIAAIIILTREILISGLREFLAKGQIKLPVSNLAKLKVEGIKLNISNWRRPAPNTIPWDTKASGLYMICTLSKHEAEKQGYTDSLMLDHDGNVAEATGANIFFKDKNGEIHTPIPDSFLDGITRRTVIGIAKSKNIKVHERKINPSELSNFVGCFLTGTAAEVTPVSCIAENQFKVCETIISLNESYQALVRKKKAA